MLMTADEPHGGGASGSKYPGRSGLTPGGSFENFMLNLMHRLFESFTIG
jgi:hypothetical protein